MSDAIVQANQGSGVLEVRGISKRFLASGATVIACGREPPESLPQAAERQAEFITADLRDEQARRAGVPVREDVQRTREAIAEQERLQALFDLIARGRPAMAQGGPVDG